MLDRLRDIGIEAREATGRVTALPAGSHDVAKLMDLARDEGRVVAPHWADASRLPAHSLLVSPEKIDGIDEVLPADLMAVAGAGVTVGTLGERVSPDGLFWPPSVLLDPSEFLGDAVARLPSGWTMLGGLTRRYLLALSAVLASGDLLRAGARTVKSVTGYDLKQMFVGSRGTLGIITGLTLRLEAEANREMVVERYRRDYAGLEVSGPVGAGRGVDRRSMTSGPRDAATAAGADGSMFLLAKLKREFDPEGLLPSIESMFDQGAAEEVA
jgi:FAD/FMN-containing dehydrogenase